MPIKEEAMKFRRIIFICCTIFTIVLFVDGVRYLKVINEKTKEKYITRQNSYSSKTGIIGLKPVNIIVLGLDEDQVRSDVITLLNFDPEQSRLNVLSIARDTMVYYKGRRMKINALIGTGGNDLILEKVEEITGLHVDYFLTMNFEGFRKIIDVLGGVEIDVPFDMNYDDPEQNLHIHLKKGNQILDGDKAEQFVRYRKGNRPGQGYTEGDLGRIKTQQDFVKNLIEQKMKMKYLLKVDDIFIILQKYTTTNINLNDISFYFKSLKKIKPLAIKTFTTPGDSGFFDNLWYFIYDEDKTRELINANFSH